MLTPIFAHGTYDNTIQAIEDGKLVYPAYLWISDRKQYGFLNKHGDLELICIPEYTGTSEDMIILSSLEDGLYQIKGQHKITPTYETVFTSFSPIIVVIQTINNKKKIRRITADELTTYTVENDMSVRVNEVATKDYLDEHHYATESYVDAKVAAMEQVIMDNVEAVLPSMVEAKIDEMIGDIDDNDIEDLFG